ncbi:MAG TPA: hypothetical protein VN554_00130 [Verrucomicrobiae bacterium]|nr:hypothetical protein [Verrucomicrobiae bacterium]
MSQEERIGIVQLGPEGLVAERLREIIAYPGSPFVLEAVATSDQELIRQHVLGETALNTAAIQAPVPVISLESVHNTDAPVILSHLSEDDALENEVALADDRPLLVTTSDANTDRPDVALFNAYIGGDQLEELYGELRQGRIMATGSPIAIPVGIVAAPLHAAIGIETMGLETLQGWSDEDKTEIDKRYVGHISAIGDGKPEAAEADIARLLGTMEGPATIRINAKLNRASWVYGHHAWLKLHFARPTSRAEIKQLLKALRAPEELRDIGYGPDSPKTKPVKVEKKTKELKKPHKKHMFKLGRTEPMKVRTRIADVTPDGRNATLEFSSDNLVLGAAGSAAMNVAYARAMELI